MTQKSVEPKVVEAPQNEEKNHDDSKKEGAKDETKN